MQQKLIAVFVFLISMPLFALSFIIYRNYEESLELNTINFTRQITEDAIAKLDSYITDLFNMSVMPLYNKEFITYLSTPSMGLDKLKTIDLYISNLNKIKPETVSVYVFDNYGHVFYNVKTDGKRVDLDDIAPLWRQIAMDGNGSAGLFSTTEVSMRNGSFYSFSVIRLLKEFQNYSPIGFVVFDTKIDEIANSIRNINAVTGGEGMLLDDLNRVVYHSDLKMITKSLSSEEAVRRSLDSSGSFPLVLNGQRYLCTYATSTVTGWKLIVYTPYEEITKRAFAERNLAVMTTVGIIAVALSVSIAISYALTNPLRKIMLLMKKVQRGSLDARFDVKYQDEIGLLGTHFNSMIEQINDLIQEVRTTQSRKREADLNVLQNQINPHFIYNSLETIRMTALYNDDNEVSHMTYLLGKLLRYGITHQNEMTTIRAELEHLQNYTEFQNFRFANRFRLVIDVPLALYDYPCIKLIFQPLVENAINYALENKHKSVDIIIDTSIGESFLEFCVRDDGSGMEPSKLERINESFAKSTPGVGMGIGLHNVNERIRLHYGEPFGLLIKSEQGKGTTVILRMPLPEL